MTDPIRAALVECDTLKEWLEAAFARRSKAAADPILDDNAKSLAYLEASIARQRYFDALIVLHNAVKAEVPS